MCQNMNLAILMIASLSATGVYSQGVGDVVTAATNALGNSTLGAIAAAKISAPEYRYHSIYDW